MEPDTLSVAATGAPNGCCAAPAPSYYASSTSYRPPPGVPPPPISISQAAVPTSAPISPAPTPNFGTYSAHRSNRLLVPITPLNRPYTSGSLEWQFLHAAEVGDKPLMARVLQERERERAAALACRAAEAAAAEAAAAAAAARLPVDVEEDERLEQEPEPEPEPPSSLNINCTDILGRSALVIAVDNENVEMVELLLRQRGIQLGDALLYAIKEVRAALPLPCIALLENVSFVDETSRVVRRSI